jgi:hypothetical protein
VPKRFWLPVGHATGLAQQQLVDAGWMLTSDPDWDLAWTLDPPDPAIFASAANGRWLNHLRGINALTLKSHLCVTLREAAARASAAGVPSLYDFAPETYLLPEEWDAWLRARAWHPDAVWIQKPAGLSRGRGVALVNDPREIGGEPLVIQRYISNPHLLDGFKYSLRFYVLIVSLDPLIAYLFDGGFTKLASRPFSLDAVDRADRFRHLTNPDVLRDDPETAAVSGRNTTHRAYRQRLRDQGLDDGLLWKKIRRVLAATVGAAQPFMRAAEQAYGGTARGQFELLGIDLTIDDALAPWLLECNLSPSLSVEASANTEASREEADIKVRVIRDSLAAVGVTDADGPPAAPSTAGDARARLAWHEQRRGGLERLWPSAAALESLAGAEFLSPLDIALLEDEAAHSHPPVVLNGVETIQAQSDTLIYDPRRERVTLLGAEEAQCWYRRQGVEWLRLGWLAPADAAASARESSFDTDLRPRLRNNWNRERVYRVHGLRVAISGETPRLEESIERALAWWEDDGAQQIDATIHVGRRSSIADVLAEINVLALTHRGGVVRRSCALISRGEEYTLVLSDAAHGEAITRPIVFGGTPFGAWLEEGGAAQLLPISSIVAARRSVGEVVLDLVSDGPGVVRAFSGASIRALAGWLATLPIVSATEN